VDAVDACGGEDELGNRQEDGAEHHEGESSLGRRNGRRILDDLTLVVLLLERDTDGGDQEDPEEDAEESKSNLSVVETVVLENDGVGEEEAAVGVSSQQVEGRRGDEGSEGGRGSGGKLNARVEKRVNETEIARKEHHDRLGREHDCRGRVSAMYITT
jgi:hypothetical protein